MANSSRDFRLLIRADGGSAVGGGHLIRCLTLAESLRTNAADITFAVRDDTSSFTRKIRDAGFRVHQLADQELPQPLLSGAWPADLQLRDLELTLQATEPPFDAVVVDHYGLDALWETAIRSQTPRILAIDDLANRRHDADLLIDQNWYGSDTDRRYNDLLPTTSLQLLGPRYALLQPEYAARRRLRSPRKHPPERILISYGGSDPMRETEKVVTALMAREFSQLQVAVVLGSQAALTEPLAALVERRPRTELHIGLPTIAPLLDSVDLVFGASGAGTWERLCLDTPAIVTTTSQAHSGVTSALADEGLTIWAGISGSVSPEDYGRLLNDYAAAPPLPSVPVVDGRGADRVAFALKPQETIHLTARMAQPTDAPMFTGVDPTGPPNAPLQTDGPRTWKTEHARFREALRRSDQAVLVILADQVPVGRALATIDGPNLAVSYTLDDTVSRLNLAAPLARLLGSRSWRIDRDRLLFSTDGFDYPATVDESTSPYASFDLATGTIASTPL